MNRAIERALLGYGPELRRLVGAIVRDDAQAHDAFSTFCECLLKGLPDFRWECSFRTWAQRMARNTCFKLLNAPPQRHPHVSLSEVPVRAAERLSSMRPWQCTTVKNRFRALREQLDPEQQRLLELRVDRRLSWPEVARLMCASEAPVTSELRARQAAALRQQFQRLKAHLRSLALQEGLIPRTEAHA
ncbi:sigma-70 family RNA polymerase sigma factor [Pyxidicoccus parkwayensis]|uniref:Sigma-70 family RNA polymerase sigma factor n=1 Tax=Pyxidicoccus parkwayensis TaxID=2813578 RepID=A0ABX7NZG6_9BACT|nr:sigma-70 family RNA polymerase sigma factor [Pyxidicoccus parkwaysis]QSQ22882.1 sigma-70 family RNA polymerase sigma factor [Pyxidicoccus parkwaysis]